LRTFLMLAKEDSEEIIGVSIFLELSIKKKTKPPTKKASAVANKIT
jgi:hypothetical protein